jgi:hypothetical protein
MTAVRVRDSHFFGSSKVFGKESDALTAIVRGLAIDNARTKLEVAAITAFTDNSTGTASAEPFSLVDAPVAASGVFDASSAGGVQRSAFNTSVGKINNAHAVLGKQLNLARSRVGLKPVSGLATGTIATAGTLPALDLTATTASGTSAVDHASYVAVCAVLKSNHRIVERAAKEVFASVGEPIVTDALTGAFDADYVLDAPGTVAAAATGASSVKLIDGTNLLADMANNIASLAAKWNAVFVGAGLTALTDSSGGTASTINVLGALGTMTPFTTAATDCSPKAGFDTLLGVYRNTFASFAARANLVAEEFGLPVLVDSSAGTPGTTIAATAASLTAVTGTTVCLEAASALTAWNAVKANFATLTVFINTYLAPAFGVGPVVDNTGGVADTTAPFTLVAMPTTATGVSGASLSSVADTEVDTNLAAAQINVATIAAKLNEMLGTTADYRPLSVVAV